MSAFCLKDDNHAVIRSLLAQRCFSKAGLTLNDSVAETYTITLAGTVHTGDVVTITVNGTVTTFTTTGSETTLTLLGHAVDALLNATDEVSSSHVAGVITVLATPITRGLTVTAAITGTGATTTVAVTRDTKGPKAVETANAINFGIDGHTGSKAATVDIVMTGGVLAAASFRWYLVVIDTDGNITTVAGEDNVAFLPAIPDSKAPIGAVKVTTAAGYTFTPDVTSLNGTGITAAYYDLSCVPAAGVPA
jgi:hypothetical protein